jgi:hypothetical protein
MGNMTMCIVQVTSAGIGSYGIVMKIREVRNLLGREEEGEVVRGRMGQMYSWAGPMRERNLHVQNYAGLARVA